VYTYNMHTYVHSFTGFHILIVYILCRNLYFCLNFTAFYVWILPICSIYRLIKLKHIRICLCNKIKQSLIWSLWSALFYAGYIKESVDMWPTVGPTAAKNTHFDCNSLCFNLWKHQTNADFYLRYNKWTVSICDRELIGSTCWCCINLRTYLRRRWSVAVWLCYTDVD